MLSKMQGKLVMKLFLFCFVFVYDNVLSFFSETKNYLISFISQVPIIIVVMMNTKKYTLKK